MHAPAQTQNIGKIGKACPTKDMTGVCPKCFEHTDLCEPCCPCTTVEEKQSGFTSNECTCQEAS